MKSIFAVLPTAFAVFVFLKQWTRSFYDPDFILKTTNICERNVGDKEPWEGPKEGFLALEDISLNARNIFLLEVKEDIKEIPERLFCSIESASRYNPTKRVYLVVSDKAEVRSLPVWFTSQVRNVALVKADFDALTAQTPVHDLWQSGKIDDLSWYPLRHKSNLLRLALLYKFGGLYMDTDFLWMERNPWDCKNFIQAERHTEMSNALFQMTRHHPFLEFSLSEFVSNYESQSKIWAHQGSYLVQWFMLAKCRTTNAPEDAHITERFDCSNMDVTPLHNDASIPIHYPDCMDFFDCGKNEFVFHKIRNTGAFALHYWHNAMSKSGPSELQTIETCQPLYKLFQQHCPVSHENTYKARYDEAARKRKKARWNLW